MSPQKTLVLGGQVRRLADLWNKVKGLSVNWWEGCGSGTILSHGLSLLACGLGEGR